MRAKLSSYSELSQERSFNTASSRSLLVVLILVLIAWGPSDVWASSGHGVMPPPPFSEFLAHLAKYWFNFLFFCALIFFFGRKPLGRVFSARRSVIEDRVLAGRRALEAAEKELLRVENLVSRRANDIQRLHADIKNETEAEVQQLLEEATRRAERTQKQTQESIAAERRNTEKQVERELIEAALLLAREKLSRGSSQESDRAVRSSVLRQFGDLVQ